MTHDDLIARAEARLQIKDDDYYIIRDLTAALKECREALHKLPADQALLREALDALSWFSEVADVLQEQHGTQPSNTPVRKGIVVADLTRARIVASKIKERLNG